MATVNNC